jgi:IS1 family transposase
MPTREDKLTIFSDGNDDYSTVLLERFQEDSINYGQKIKTKNGMKVFPAIKRIVYGNMNFEDIETNTVESINSVLRDKLSKLHRKTKKIPKNRFSLNSSIWLFKFAWNFIHKRHGKSLTPAMIEKISNKRWTWGMFLHAKLSYIN